MTDTPSKPAGKLKKALIPTLLVVLPGGALLGLAYYLAKKHQAKKPKS